MHGDPALNYLMNDTAGTTTGSFSRFFYLIQQIWLKKFYVHFTFTPLKVEYNFDIVSIRHLLFRVALYNDTDNDGLMDLSFNETANGFYYPYSSEAVCMFDLVKAADIVFGEPVIDETPGNEKLSWNATIKNPTVRLYPYGQSAEIGMMLDGPVVPMEDTAFGFTFRPQTIGSGRTITLNGLIKVDQTFGAINGTEGLTGIYKDLDLAVLYLSDVFELRIQDKINASAPQFNATAYTGSGVPIPPTVNKTTSTTESLDFFIDTSRVAGLNLTSDKYSIDNEDPTNPTHTANSAIIPWALYKFTIDQTGEAANQRGSVEWNLSAGVTYNTYFYEICYPDFNGSKLVHDPTYVIYGDVTYPGAIPGFELWTVGIGFFIACLVLLLKRKKVILKI